MKLKFTETAIRDLKRLKAFIAKKNPQAATLYIRRLKKSINGLRDQPEMGTDLEELEGVQQWVANDYIVRYTIRSETIFVLRIWHTREDR